jgi:hypothetical protein
LDLLVSKPTNTVSGLLEKITTRLIEKNYLKHKLWQSSEVKKLKTKAPSVKVSGKQIFDGFEKVHKIANFIPIS